MGDDSKACAACGPANDSFKRCTGCKLVYCCGRECQLAHRKNHRKLCEKEQERLLKKKKEDDNELDDPPVIVFFVERFVQSLMLPLLGSQDPVMWDILFEKKGAKERIHNHMLNFALTYVANHNRYSTPAKIQQLLEADYHKDTSKEPFLAAMQKELYVYLKEEEHFP